MRHLAEFSGPRVARLLAAALGVLAFALWGPPSTAQDGDAAPSDARSCIGLNEIDHTSVIDNNTILFYARGHDVYRNYLPRSCPDLKNDQRFMYRVALPQLCANDTITVLEDAGFGFMPGATCGLGKFAPISKDEADELEQQSHARERERRRH